MSNLHATIKLETEEGEFWHESVPDAVAHCRRYFLDGGKTACRILQDDLIYTVEISPTWNGERLP